MQQQETGTKSGTRSGALLKPKREACIGFGSSRRAEAGRILTRSLVMVGKGKKSHWRLKKGTEAIYWPVLSRPTVCSTVAQRKDA